MAMENHNFIETVSKILEDLLGKKVQVIGVPEDQWHNIREKFISEQRVDSPNEVKEPKEDPLVAEAKKLFGENLVEIKE